MYIPTKIYIYACICICHIIPWLAIHIVNTYIHTYIYINTIVYIICNYNELQVPTYMQTYYTRYTDVSS